MRGYIFFPLPVLSTGTIYNSHEAIPPSGGFLFVDNLVDYYLPVGIINV